MWKSPTEYSLERLPVFSERVKLVWSNVTEPAGATLVSLARLGWTAIDALRWKPPNLPILEIRSDIGPFPLRSF